MNEIQAQEMGYQKRYDFTQYSHENNVNVIPEEDFKRLVQETFKCIADNLRKTYGPYASTVMISNSSNETFATKDGYNVFNALGFSHTYKRMVYLAIQKIIERVNRNVGDGTTSCILIAEKLFLYLQNSIKTVDDKRNIFGVLNDIEAYLLNHEMIDADKESGCIKNLSEESLAGLIRVAGNYDDNIVDTLMEALQPIYNSNNIISEVRNVVVDAQLERDSDTLSYNVDFLPGDYRIRINMDPTFALTFAEPRPVRIAVYDHQFGPDDWNFFTTLYDWKTETIIIARSFATTFLENEWKSYLFKSGNHKKPITIILCEIKGEYLRDELKDLAAVLQTELIGKAAKAVDHDELVEKNVQIHNGICMCFDMDEIPTHHIEVVEHDREVDQSTSLTKMQWYDDRIRALSNKSKDTLVTVYATSSLEKKMVADKIDDCVSIINSAMSYGIVPNLFVYGYYRMSEYIKACNEDKDTLKIAAAEAIMHSIEGLFKDIWTSKHGNEYEKKCADISKQLYTDSPNFESFNIIKEGFVPTEELPTSAQYDLEVIAAAISIVKYLLTSNALVFDAYIMKPVDDTGKYELV